MSGDASAFGFGKFIPGFDFLQGLAQSAGTATNPMGSVPKWVAPTVSVEEIDKRIAELKAVQFWLEQNGRALNATIQALEVQRMTLSTLKDMNVSMSELAKSFPFPGAAAAAEAHKTASTASHGGWPMWGAAAKAESESVQEPAPEPAAKVQPQPEPERKREPEPEPQAETQAHSADEPASGQTEKASQAALGQAMQWWGALTQQFQQIAAKAMAEPVAPQAMAAAQQTGEAVKSAMEKVMQQASQLGAGVAAGKETEPSADELKKQAPKAAPRKTAAAKKTVAKKTVAKKAVTTAEKKTSKAAAPQSGAAKKPAAKTSASARKT